MKQNKGIIGVLVLVFGFIFLNQTPQNGLKVPPKITKPATPVLSETIVKYREYPDVIKMLQAWEAASPQLVKVGFLEGKTQKGTQIVYAEITNRLNKGKKDEILIHACIHGNEVLANTVCLSYAASLLSEYGKDSNATRILDNCDIYFIPVFSPDSFARSRAVDNVDPNRDFPSYNAPNHKSTPTVKAVADFFLKHKFKGVISMHTYGRCFLTPFGYSWERCKDEEKFKELFSEMAKLSGYQWKHAVELYSRPIHGSDVDFYYMHGAISCVMELGDHQRIPTIKETQYEFNKTYSAIKWFLLSFTN